jgi:hypothetical protein
MSILRIRYANQLAVSEFDLQDQVNLMKGEAAILKAILGSTTQLDGFECTPNSPADLNVIVGEGTITILKDVLDTALGELPTQIAADTTHEIVKYAYTLDPTTVAITPPSTPGFSRNDLIQISFQEADGNPVSIPFYNGFTGQVLNPPVFATKDAQRIDSVVISLKPGTPAATGTQVTPSPDVGYVGAWVVTTVQGQTTINNSDISEYPNAPFLNEKLKDKISQAFADARYGQITTIQSGGYLYAAASGAANTYTASLSPAITAYATGMVVNIKINVANTGASTINLNGLGVKNIKLLGGVDPVAGELAANMLAELYYDGTQFILLNPYAIVIIGSVYSNVQQSIPGGNTAELLTFNTTEFDSYNLFSGAPDYKYTAIKAGFYRVGFHMFAVSHTSGNNFYIEVFKNGTRYKRLDEVTWGGNNVTLNGTAEVYLNVNDYVQLYAYNDAATAVMVNGGSLVYNSFEIEYLGA